MRARRPRRRVRVVFCPSCQKVSVLTRLEPEVCPRCGARVLSSKSRRPWQYYASAGVLVAATAYIILGDPTLLLRWAVFLAAVGLAAGLAVWSSRSLRARVMEEMATHDAKGGRA